MRGDLTSMDDMLAVTKSVDAIVHLGGYSVEGPWEAILNANKHARATQIVLEVARAKNELVFSVRDNGVGLKKTKGHGLGFHIMKYRAESIGARLELEALKKGSQVTCCLPISKMK